MAINDPLYVTSSTSTSTFRVALDTEYRNLLLTEVVRELCSAYYNVIRRTYVTIHLLHGHNLDYDQVLSTSIINVELKAEHFRVSQIYNTPFIDKGPSGWSFGREYTFILRDFDLTDLVAGR